MITKEARAKILTASLGAKFSLGAGAPSTASGAGAPSTASETRIVAGASGRFELLSFSFLSGEFLPPDPSKLPASQGECTLFPQGESTLCNELRSEEKEREECFKSLDLD